MYQQEEIPRVIGFSYLPSPALFVGGIDFDQMSCKIVYTDSVSNTDEMNFVFEIERLLRPFSTSPFVCSSFSSFGFGNRNFGVGLEVQLGSTYSIVLPETSRAFVASVFPVRCSKKPFLLDSNSALLQPMKEDESSSEGWKTLCHSGKLPDLCLNIGGKPLCFPSWIFSEVDYSQGVCSINFRFHDSFLTVVPGKK